RFTDSDGKPLVLRHGEAEGSEIPYSIEPNGTFRALLTRTAGTAAGYAVAAPDAGSAAPAGAAIFQFKKDGILVSEAGVLAAPSTTSARILVDNAGTYTGVALANPSSAPANVTFELLDRYGASIDTATRALAPGGHLAVFAHELFPGLSSSFTGVVEI